MKRASSAAVAAAAILIICRVFSADGYAFNSRVQDGDIPEVQETNAAGSRFQGPETAEDGAEDGVDWPRGDIILDTIDGNAGRFRRQAVASDTSLWPEGQIIYTVSAVLARQNRPMAVIKAAIQHWENRTCIRFQRVTQDELYKSVIPKRRKYVIFKGALMCGSHVGMERGSGHQNVEMSRGCTHTFQIIHELGHLIGLWHEQSRRDRDAHVLIMWNNIKDRTSHNFNKVWKARLLTPYDLSSMMHYDMKMFSKNGEPTLTPLDSRLAPLIGMRGDLSFYDTKAANELYKCAANCPKADECLNDGFQGSDCGCVCPDGLTGSRCEVVDTDPECGGVVKVSGRMMITSPGFPARYSNNRKCVWLLLSPVGTYMSLQLLDIDITDKKDQLVIRYHNIGVEKGPQFSWKDLNDTVKSVDNKAIIHFNTGSSMTSKGFRINVDVQSQKDCSSSPCKNGGDCEEVPAIATYVCDCRTGWVGKDCHIPVVDGGFSAWSEWGACVASCGMQARNRSCTDPAPNNGGNECTGATYDTRLCGDLYVCDDYFNCDFGSERASTTCGLKEDTGPDRLAWMVTSGQTSSAGTGPPAGHTTGGPGDMYYYLEASVGRPWEKAISWLPPLKAGAYCLEFFYSLHGTSVSTLIILKRVAGKDTSIVWQHTGEEGPQWRGADVSLQLTHDVQIGFMAVKGKTYSGDIAIDDISISPGQCGYGARFAYANQQQAACSFHGEPVRRGRFTYMKGCARIVCFCNQDGLLDCPQWKNVPGACKTSKTDKRRHPSTKNNQKQPSKQKTRWNRRSKSPFRGL